MLRHDAYDVVIVGGGVAGCCTALSLLQLDDQITILIIDRKGNEQLGTSIRVGETLPPQASARLQELNLWKRFQRINFHRSYGTAAVWGSDEIYHNEFIASPYGYGWHVDRQVFDKMMIDAVLDKDIEYIFNASVTDLSITNSVWTIDLKKGGSNYSVSSKFVVDATGKKASIATRFGSNKIKSDHLIGIIRAYTAENNQLAGSGAVVEAVPEGWWYSSRLNEGTTVTCLMTDADISKTKKLLDEIEFQKSLESTNYTFQRVGKPISELKIKAAHTQILDNIVGDGWLAVGDSASSFDPLSALGVFKAMNLSKIASFAIKDYLMTNPLGLKRYEKVVKQNFQSYLDKKNEYYCEEKRFKGFPFWDRRNSVEMETSSLMSK